MIRLASMLYESLLLGSVLFVAGYLFVAVFHGIQSTPAFNPLFRVYLLAIIAAYFLWFWLHGGQTLAMKTWRLRVVSNDGVQLTPKQALLRKNGEPLTPKQAVLRFVFALVGVLLGFGILWALFDRDRQFWHDRMAGTKIIRV